MSRDARLLSAVLPVYCEASHLADSLAVIRNAVADLGVPYELIVVDDGSIDETPVVLERLAAGWPELRVLTLARNFGKEAAVSAGLERARGSAVLVMDADLQHPPALIAELFAKWRDGGYDVVNAVKRRRGDEGRIRGTVARLYYRAFERLVGAKLAGSSDFKLLDRRVVDAYCELPERNVYFRGLVSWMGFRQADIPFDVAERTGGISKWSMFKLMALAFSSIVSFSAIPLQFVTVSGMLFLVFALGLALQTIYVKLSGGAEAGFSTVILLMLISSSILMIALGIIGQYLAKIYDEVKRRPRYLLKDERRPVAVLKEADAHTRRNPARPPRAHIAS